MIKNSKSQKKIHTLKFIFFLVKEIYPALLPYHKNFYILCTKFELNLSALIKY